MILGWPFLKYLCYAVLCQEAWTWSVSGKSWRGRGKITADVATSPPTPTFREKNQSGERRAGESGRYILRSTRREQKEGKIKKETLWNKREKENARWAGKKKKKKRLSDKLKEWEMELHCIVEWIHADSNVSNRRRLETLVRRGFCALSLQQLWSVPLIHLVSHRPLSPFPPLLCQTSPVN